MFWRLLLLFVLVPLVELALLVYVGTLIGVLYTLLIVIGTGILGAVLARNQGLATLSRIRASVERGIIPSNELFDGALILVGALFLLTPGILTDILGLGLLLPPTRRVIRRFLRSFVQRRIQEGRVQYWEVH